MTLVLPLQFVGPGIVPFNVVKQTALLSIVEQQLPRLFNGIGPRLTKLLSIADTAATSTSRVTMIMDVSDTPLVFAQVRPFSGSAPPSLGGGLAAGLIPHDLVTTYSQARTLQQP